jgi:hypothetical protein
MSYISDSKSAPFDLFNQYKGTGTTTSDGTQNPDFSYDALCGTRFKVEGDGREVVLVATGAAAITQGVMVQAPAELTAFEKMAITVPTAVPATAGTYQVYVTNGGTAMKQNLFAGGFLVVASGTGIGQTLKIASHTAAVASSGFITVTLEDPIQVTLDATSTVSFVANPYGSHYQGVIIAPSTETGAPVGATLYALSASTAPTWNGTSGALTAGGTPYYGLIVCKGTVGVLVDNTVTNVGYSVGRSAATPGAVGVETLTTTGFVGTAMQTLTSAQVGPIFLDL